MAALIKSTHSKFTAALTFKAQILNALPLKLRTRQERPILLLSFGINTVLEVLAADRRQGRKDLRVEKEEIKASLFADDTIIFE